VKKQFKVTYRQQSHLRRPTYRFKRAPHRSLLETPELIVPIIGH